MPTNFDNVPVTSYRRREDGRFDVQQCFDESRCSSDGRQCSKCTICKSTVAHRVAAKKLGSAFASRFPTTKDGAYFFMPVEEVTASAVRELKSASTGKCVEVAPCQGRFLPSICCREAPAAVGRDETAATARNLNADPVNNTRAGVPWWTWLLVALSALFLVAIIVLAVLLVRGHMKSAAPQIPASPTPSQISAAPIGAGRAPTSTNSGGL